MPAGRTPQERSRIPPGVSTLVLLCSGVALLGWLFFAAQLLRTHRIDAAGLFPADHPLTDFYLYTPTFEDYHTAAFSQIVPGHSRFAYPPLMAPIYAAFYALPHKTSFYLAFTALVWLGLLVWALRFVRHQGASPKTYALCLCSGTLAFPALFLLERGNLEIFVWAAAAGGMLLFTRGRTGWAAVLFGVATALKIYPILLFGLLLPTGRWLRNLALGVATAMGLSAVAVWFSGPTFALAGHGFLAGVAGFQQHYALKVRLSEFRYDHSLFSIVKVLALRSGHSFAGLAPVYYLACAVVFGSLYLLRVRHLPWLNQLLFLTVGMILLPPVSYEYTLVHLYVPALLLAVTLAAGKTDRKRAGLYTLIALLFLLLPNDLLSVSTTFMPGQVQAIALLAVALLACLPLTSSEPLTGSP